MDEKSRPEWNQLFMNITELVSQRSTCVRIQTASIIVKDDRIISMGYNGVVSGAEHCLEHWKIFYDSQFGSQKIWKFGDEVVASYTDFLKSRFFYDLHHEWSVHHELHGEQNAILYSCKIGISTKDTTMYTLYAPCIHCAKVIITAGIIKVFYKEEYSRDPKGLIFLRENNVNCEKIKL